MHEQTDLVELSVTPYTIRKRFVDTAENGPFKVPTFGRRMREVQPNFEFLYSHACSTSFGDSVGCLLYAACKADCTLGGTDGCKVAEGA